ncbi:hypothetical protein ACFO0N_07330 [Halobium salinum]|uniref:Uncharacterized protein n=1 Tax=Halobium salinum TaxID=1364940 RepID=A0ABD5PA42_9EURY|nr:hypothetical protein [Halobium salinum]
MVASDFAQDLARTYNGSDSWERVEDYQRCFKYAAEHPQKGSYAVASALDLPRGTVRQWIERGSKPDPVHAVETADELGWLDVPSKDATGRALNLLVAGIYSGGSVSKSFVPTWTIDREPVELLLSTALEQAGSGAKRIDRMSDSRATELAPAEHASVLGRLLVTLGAPQGTKNESTVTDLPEYLESVERRVHVEFAKMYILNRATSLEGKDTLQLNESRTTLYKRELAEFLSMVAGEPVRATKNGVVVSAAAARALGFGRGDALREAIHEKRTSA